MKDQENEKCWACHGSGIVLSESSSLDGESSHEEHPCNVCSEKIKTVEESFNEATKKLGW